MFLSKRSSLLVIIAVLVCSSMDLLAQLKFKNSTQNPISVAIGWYAVRDNYTGYITKGWFTVNPGQTVTTDLQFSGTSDYFYYHAISSTSTWAGENELLVDPSSAFEIMNANMKYVATENPEYSWKGFKRIDLSFGENSSHTYTMDLTTTAEDEGLAIDTAVMEVVSYPIGGNYKQDGNKLQISALESSVIKFTITTPVEGDCISNSITGVAEWKMFGTPEEGFEYWEYSEGGCTITFMINVNGGVAVSESDCQAKHCEGGYDWGGTYNRQ